MSTRRTDYVIAGAKLSYIKGDAAYEILRPWEEKKEGIICVSDGMCGEYMFVGQLIAKSDEYEGFYPVMVPPGAFYIEETRSAIDEIGLWKDLKKIEYGIWIFSHFH